jgi:NAD(P)-dependent dehydrogenase (short-subunit alcohol dehydrogenase family)
MNEFGEAKVALVTGSSSGIGEAIARRLSALGASVVINSAKFGRGRAAASPPNWATGCALRAGRHRRQGGRAERLLAMPRWRASASSTSW